MVQIFTKTDSWFQKSPEEFGQLQTSSENSKKLKFDTLLLSKKIKIPSAKTLYTEDSSTITFNYFAKFAKFVKPFLKPQDIFHNTTPLYFFSSKITYFLQNQRIKVQIFRVSTARIKTHQILHVIFQTKIQFSLKVCVTVQCHKR